MGQDEPIKCNYYNLYLIKYVFEFIITVNYSK